MSFLRTLQNNRRFRLIAVALLCLIWIAIHIPGITYGTWQLPLHQSYVGDEQAPVAGALHIISDKSILGVRTTNNYYGPLFAVIALPGVATDFLIKYFTGVVSGPEGYKNFILFDWGGIVTQIRLMAVIWSLIGLMFIYSIFDTETINPKNNRWLPWAAVLLIASNYYFFEYSHFFKHWIFILVTLFAQIYLLIRIEEEDDHTKRRKLWMLQAVAFIVGFGISYINLAFQILWLPVIIRWIYNRSWSRFKGFLIHLIYCALGAGLMILWHPYAFFRIAAGNAFVRLGMEAETALRYYSHLVFLNQLAVLLAGLLLAVWLWKKEKIYRSVLFWALFLPAAVNFIIFSIPVRYEGRYMLPTIMLALLWVGYLGARYARSGFRNSVVTAAVIALLAFNTAFHVVHDIEWIAIYNRGPVEQEMIRSLLMAQHVKPLSKTLLIQDYIAGHAHTRPAYIDYMKKSGKTDVNLYQQILAAEYPKDILPINAYYLIPQELSKFDQRIYYINPGKLPIAELAKQYDFIGIRYKPRLEPNQFDFFDEDLVRLWTYKDQSDHYIYIH